MIFSLQILENWNIHWYPIEYQQIPVLFCLPEEGPNSHWIQRVKRDSSKQKKCNKKKKTEKIV